MITARIAGSFVLLAFASMLFWHSAAEFGLIDALKIFSSAVGVTIAVVWAVGALVSESWNPFRGMW